MTDIRDLQEVLNKLINESTSLDVGDNVIISSELGGGDGTILEIENGQAIVKFLNGKTKSYDVEDLEKATLESLEDSYGNEYLDETNISMVDEADGADSMRKYMNSLDEDATDSDDSDSSSGQSEDIDEGASTAKGEEFVKSHKDEFKKRYGDNWERVLYATANKQFPKAKKESLDEDDWGTIEHTGEYADKTVGELRDMRDTLKDKKDHTADETKKLRQIDYAIRAKTGFGKVESKQSKEKPLNEMKFEVTPERMEAFQQLMMNSAFAKKNKGSGLLKDTMAHAEEFVHLMDPDEQQDYFDRALQDTNAARTMAKRYGINLDFTESKMNEDDEDQQNMMRTLMGYLEPEGNGMAEIVPVETSEEPFDFENPEAQEGSEQEAIEELKAALLGVEDFDTAYTTADTIAKKYGCDTDCLIKCYQDTVHNETPEIVPIEEKPRYKK